MEGEREREYNVTWESSPRSRMGHGLREGPMRKDLLSCPMLRLDPEAKSVLLPLSHFPRRLWMISELFP
jgi:hypothetical protein